VAAGGLIWLAGAATTLAVPDNTWTPPTAQSTGSTTAVQVMRARDFLGTDVMSADQRKVGDIVDFIFDTAAPPRLAYVLVMSGGFLDLGGAVRAIPAEALTRTGDGAHIGLTRDEFLATPSLPRGSDRQLYLSNPQNVARLYAAFRVPAPPNLAGGAASPSTLVAYSDMHRQNAYSTKNGQIGFIDDVWLSLNRDRAPFVEITPMFNPFEVSQDRYAIPMARLQPNGSNEGQYTFAVTVNELKQANPVNDTAGVQVVNDGFVGNEVLRVDVAAASDAARPGAGRPTGYTSAQQTGSASSAAVSAAERIRSAFDADAALRQADVQVVPHNDKVVLKGTVDSDSLRDRIETSAANAANAVSIEDQITVRTR
jgi:hypothetical protein